MADFCAKCFVQCGLSEFKRGEIAWLIADIVAHEKCSIQYCLNAHAVAVQLPTGLLKQIDIVEVPVYAMAAAGQPEPP